MDQRKLVDIVCNTGLSKMGGEVGALLGQEFTCTDIKLDLTTKHQIFSRIDREKSALTRMTVGGDREGNCYLLSTLKAAITLGSTLIMLPEDVIEEQVIEEKLDGEANDAFGEIANIVAGVLTQAFVDKYPKTLRFIKKTVEELVPTKIDPDSDSPFPPGEYYLASCKMDFEGTDLGRLEFIVPAEVFDLATAPKTAPEPEQAADQVTPQATAKPAAEEPQPAPKTPETPAPQPVQAAKQAAAQPQAVAQPAAQKGSAPAPKKPKFADAKKLADVVFKASVGQIGEEVGALLGQTFKCDDLQLVMTSKADFFSNHCIDKSILTTLKISGDRQGTGYLLALVPDAIVLGGTLIMLPEDVIEEEKAEGDFSGEAADAYGEIANIIAGGLTETFLERYPKQLRFVKTDSSIIVPTKVDPASDQPFAEGSYYLASFAIHIDEFELHRFLLIFPAEVFDLEAQAETTQHDPAASKPEASEPAAASGAAQKQDDQPAPGEWGGPPAEESAQAATTTAKTDNEAKTAVAPKTAQPVAATATTANADSEAGAATAQPAAATAPIGQSTGEPVVLLISDQKNAAEPFVEILASSSYQCRVLSFHDEIREVLQQHQVLGIFLIMSQVGEKGFAAAIKLQSAGRPMPPLIFAGSQWTRSAVLRAVKYGAKDIIVTPASGSEIQDKASLHFRKAS